MCIENVVRSFFKMLSILFIHSFCKAQQLEDIFANKDCKTVEEWNVDPPSISNTQDCCVQSIGRGFYVKGATNLIITDSDGKEYQNAYGAADGKYLIKTTTDALVQIEFVYLDISFKETKGSITKETQTYLVTKQNWEGHLRYDVNYVSELEFSITSTRFAVYNPEGYTAEVVPDQGIMISKDSFEFGTEKISVTGTDHYFDISKTGTPGPYYPEASESYSASIKITAQKQSQLPQKVILVERGVFYGDSEDLTDEEIADNVEEASKNNTDNPGLNGGEIAGIVIAAVVVVALVVFCIVYFGVLKKGCGGKIQSQD